MSEKIQGKKKGDGRKAGGEKNEHREGDEWEFNGLRKTGMNKKEENRETAQDSLCFCAGRLEDGVMGESAGRINKFGENGETRKGEI